MVTGMVPTVLALWTACAAAGSAPSCSTAATPRLDARYAADHANFLCMNYTRPVPLPCRAAVLPHLNLLRDVGAARSAARAAPR